MSSEWGGLRGQEGVPLWWPEHSGAQTPPQSASDTGPLTGSLSSLPGRFVPSLAQGLLAVSLTANALFTSAYLYQSLR